MDPTSLELLTPVLVTLVFAVLVPNGVSALALAKLNPIELGVATDAGVELCVETDVDMDEVTGDACTVATIGVLDLAGGVDDAWLVAPPDKNEKLPIELVLVIGTVVAIGVFSLSDFDFSRACKPNELPRSNLNALDVTFEGFAMFGCCGGIFGVANNGDDFTVDGFGVILNPDEATGVVCGVSFKLVFGVCNNAGFGESFATDAGVVAGFAKFNASVFVCVVKPNEGVLAGAPNEKPVDAVELETFASSIFGLNENPLFVVVAAESNETVLLKLVFKFDTASDFVTGFSVPNGDCTFSPPNRGFVSTGF